MQRSTLAKRAWLLCFFAVFAIYVYGLGRLPLLGPDEPRYAQVAREMWERGDWVTPTLGGRTWFEKPALLYWMMMASFDLFGVSEWAARLGGACSGVLTTFFVGWLGLRVERAAEPDVRLFGLASSLALASSAGLIVFARAASFDAPLTMTITGALVCFMVSELETNERKKSWLLIGFYAGMGLSLLAKGLIGIVIPSGIVAAYFALRRQWPGKHVRWSLLWGWVVVACLAAVWYGPVTWRHGWSFVNEFFVQHHFARYVSNKYRHPQPFYFYVPIIALLMLPWTPFVVAALGDVRRWEWRAGGTMNKLHVFAFAWLVVPVLFFSFSESKLPGYILPALPGAALLGGERLARALHNKGKHGEKDVIHSLHSIRATGALLLVLAVAVVVYATRGGEIHFACAVLIAAPLAATGLLNVVWAHRSRACVVMTMCVVFVVIVLIPDCAVKKIARRESIRDLLQIAATRGYSSAPVFNLHTIERSAEFYAAGRIAYAADGNPVRYEGAGQVAEAARRGGGRALVIVPVEHTHQLTQYQFIQTEIIGDNGGLALVAVRVR